MGVSNGPSPARGGEIHNTYGKEGYRRWNEFVAVEYDEPKMKELEGRELAYLRTKGLA